MKIVLLAPPSVEAHYAASLLVRGFTAVTIPPDVPSLDFPLLMQDYLKHDGCLLISDDPRSVEIADPRGTLIFICNTRLVGGSGPLSGCA